MCHFPCQVDSGLDGFLTSLNVIEKSVPKAISRRFSIFLCFQPFGNTACLKLNSRQNCYPLSLFYDFYVTVRKTVLKARKASLSHFRHICYLLWKRNCCGKLYITRKANAHSRIVKRYLSNIFKFKKSRVLVHILLQRFQSIRIWNLIHRFFTQTNLIKRHH